MTSTPNDTPAVLPEVIAKNLELVTTELSRTVAKLDDKQMAELSGRLGKAKRVFVVGAGRSGLVLRMAAMRLMHLGLTVNVAGDTTTPAIAEGDLLLAASGSGTTSGVVKAATTASEVGADVVAFTTNPESPLAKLCSAVVVIPGAQKTDHGSDVSKQYAGSLFEQVLFVATEAVFASLWEADGTPAEILWTRHANIE